MIGSVSSDNGGNPFFSLDVDIFSNYKMIQFEGNLMLSSSYVAPSEGFIGHLKVNQMIDFHEFFKSWAISVQMSDFSLVP